MIHHPLPSRVRARAPVRIDFGGGWTDVPPYPAEQGGFVCNVAIARYAEAVVTDGGHSSGETAAAGTDDAEARAGSSASAANNSALSSAALRRAGRAGQSLQLLSDFPIGAGLGGSSAAGVAALGALLSAIGSVPSPAELAELSRSMEVEDLGIAGGRQDHYAAAFGGALGLTFHGDGVDVERIELSDDTRHALESRCLVIYTGASRISAQTITAVGDAYAAREPRVTSALANMRECAQQMASALRVGDIDSLGELLAEHWHHQRSLHPAITTPTIDRILSRASDAGSLGGKALGASGGGCVAVIAKRDRVDSVRDAIASLGTLIPVVLDFQGFTVLGPGVAGESGTVQ
jgi:D-glycero-alpha-D-manno-heptose-7-phosphate kinase